MGLRTRTVITGALVLASTRARAEEPRQPVAEAEGSTTSRAGAPPGTRRLPSRPTARPIDLAASPRDYNSAERKFDIFNHLRALAGVLTVNYAIWQYDWAGSQRELFYVTRESIGDNFAAGFVFDNDYFRTNFFGHPYQGQLTFGAARGAGLSYWETLPYPWLASAFWEAFSETQFPSPNDFIATSWGGVVIGEALFRLSNEILDDTTGGGERTIREMAALAVSPGYGLQRVADGRAWSNGSPPYRHPVQIDLHGGVAGITADQLAGPESAGVGVLIALETRYGNLLPALGAANVDAYDFFDLYIGASGFDQSLRGAEMSLEGPMAGYNTFISDEQTLHPENNVFALSNFFDFHGSDVVQFGGTGIGVTDYLAVRQRTGLTYRLSSSLQFAALAGVTTEEVQLRFDDVGEPIDSDYNFAIGGSAALHSRLFHPKYGEIGLRGRYFITPVVDGPPGTDAAGYMRFWLKSRTFQHLGLGTALTFSQWSGRLESPSLPAARQATFRGEAFVLYRP